MKKLKDLDDVNIIKLYYKYCVFHVSTLKVIFLVLIMSIIWNLGYEIEFWIIIVVVFLMGFLSMFDYRTTPIRDSIHKEIKKRGLWVKY